MVKSAITISIRHCHIVAFRPDGIVIPQLDRLLELAKDVGIPVETSANNLVDTNALAALVQAIGVPEVDKPRKVLLLCGAYLEEQISIATRYMLMTGYDVYLLRDIIVAKNPEHTQIHDHRFLQDGAVATTLQQLSYEWIASETDPVIRIALSKLSLT